MRKIGFVVYCTLGAIILFTAGCQNSSNPSTAQTSTAPASAPSTDAADGNLASPDQTANQGNYPNSESGDEVDTEPAVYASQPPPELPDYSQPECPGENYIWNPGYWDYSSSGYYWVPGAWVLAPYVGALWTPPYWTFAGGRYRLHRGYWAPHIGFYGGINYGFGYTGRGYYGGYWNNGQFDYNRSVTNVNITVVHNVYSRTVVHNDIRISYNGGNGGVNAQPTPAEQAVLREPRTPAVAAQVQQARQAATNRAQFAQANKGHPAEVAAARPLATAYHTPAPAPAAVQPRTAAPNRVNPAEKPEARPGPEGRQPTPSERPAERAAAPNQPVRANEKAGPAAQPRREERTPTAQPRAEEKSAPPQPRPEARTPAAQPRAETKATPAQPRTEAKPAPAERRPEARPAAPSKGEQTRPNTKTEKTDTKDTEHH